MTSTIDRAVAELTLLRNDPEYWSQRCYKILDKFGHLIPLTFNEVQRGLELEEQRQLQTTGQSRIYALKARQGGVTTWAQAKNLHMIWSVPGTSALTLAHDRDTTDKIFKITERAIDKFPVELLPALGEAQAREVSFPAMDSQFLTGTAGSGRASASSGSGARARTGRGLTLWRIHGSEFAFWDSPKSTLNSAAGGLVPRGSCVILETTASGAMSEGHEYWQEAKDGANAYTPKFYPWWVTDSKNYRQPIFSPDEVLPLSEEEHTLVELHGLDLEQIAWRRLKIREYGGRTAFFQEYPEDDESCWIAAGGMFYDSEQLKQLQLLAPTPIRKEKTRFGDVQVFSDIIAHNERVIMGSDTAEGVNRDKSTWVARAFPTWRLLAKFASRTVTPEEHSDLMSLWAKTRFGYPLLVVEKNMHGITVLRRLVDLHHYPTNLIYHRVQHDRNTQKVQKVIGWYTGNESRPILLDGGRELFQAALDRNATPPSGDVIREAFAVRRDPDTGRVNLTGKDELVAELLAWQGRTYPLRTPPIISGSTSLSSLGA